MAVGIVLTFVLFHGVLPLYVWLYQLFYVDIPNGCSGNLSWEQLLKNARLRKTYVSVYASLLKSDMSRLVVDDNEDIKKLDRELDIEVILQWR